MDGKNGFTCYADWWETFKYMDDKTLADITRLIYRYVNDEHPERELPDGSILKILFQPFKTTLDRDLVKYKNKCEKNRENINKRWNTKNNESIQNNTNVYERNNSNTNYTDRDRDSDRDSDIDSVCINTHNNAHTHTKAPTLNEVEEYAKSHNLNSVSPNKFYLYYQTYGWNMDDWTNSLELWNETDKERKVSNDNPKWLLCRENPEWLDKKIENLNTEGVEDI